MSLLDQPWGWMPLGTFNTCRVCPLCSALVIDPVVHTTWHEGQEEDQ